MNTSLTRRSILAATSLVLAAGLALGACGGSSDTSAKKKDQLLNAGLQAEVQGDYATAKRTFKNFLKPSRPTSLPITTLGISHRLRKRKEKKQVSNMKQP